MNHYCITFSIEEGTDDQYDSIWDIIEDYESDEALELVEETVVIIKATDEDKNKMVEEIRAYADESMLKLDLFSFKMDIKSIKKEI